MQFSISSNLVQKKFNKSLHKVSAHQNIHKQFRKLCKNQMKMKINFPIIARFQPFEVGQRRCWSIDCQERKVNNENEMKTFYENDEMIAMNYQNHRLAPAPMLEPTTAKYLLDFIYFTRDDEQFRFYKKVSIDWMRQCWWCQDSRLFFVET